MSYREFGEMSQITFLVGSAQIITILHRGGYRNLLQYYNGGGSLGTPNLYYVIYGRPLTGILGGAIYVGGDIPSDLIHPVLLILISLNCASDYHDK